VENDCAEHNGLQQSANPLAAQDNSAIIHTYRHAVMDRSITKRSYSRFSA
jgi:hypothetical protein